MKTLLSPIMPRDAFSVSPWQLVPVTTQAPEDGPADETVYDTLIVGAGITGLTTALLLQNAGHKCLIAEAQSPGFGTTGGTSAHLNTFFDATYPEIEKDFGEEASKLVAESGREAFKQITDLIEKYRIDCDFDYKDAYLFAENEEETKQLAQILEASRKAGINVTEERENGVPVPFQLSLLFKDQGQFHPIKYLRGLMNAFTAAGGKILSDTFVRETSFENDLHLAKTDRQVIRAKNLVYATHIPPGINLLHFRCAPYRSYVLGLKLKNEDYPDKLVYDMQEPYHYFRTHVIDQQSYLILGGNDHKTGHEDPTLAFEQLEAYARKYFEVDTVDFKWSSQYYVPADGLPYIGLLPGGDERMYVATGFNGNGMVFGTLSGKIISDSILGAKNKYADLFRPSRVKPVAGFTEFIKENADVAYHFLADRLSAETVDSLKDLKTGTGTVIYYDDQKLAVYKDENERITALSPVCTHAGCIVNFNAEEKSWDCPCHGGRFDLQGKVLTGPPRKDLEHVNIS
jgi:glycine/D-amino acid oxidase-like deaminating enzyme/nitrite reductase/ring-hydroxylating ferredoxin subunit